MTVFSKRLAYTAAVFLVLAIALHLFTSRYTIAIAHQECLPERVWLIDKTVKPANRGEYIAFIGRNIPRFTDATKLTKIIAGVPGDTIVVKPASGEHELTINGMKRLTKVKAEVSVVAKGTLKRFIVYETGSDGRPLPFYYQYGSYTIPKGHYFVAGKAPYSYDSRYWGVISENNVIGKAYPIY